MTKKPATTQADILSYRHPDRRKNNPEVGMVTPATDPDEGKTRWRHDPHLDPTLSWTGKAERTSFDVDTVSLHVHERIDPASILSAVRRKVGAGETAKEKGKGAKAARQKAMQPGLFDAPFESLPLRDAIDFYKHDKGWSNRLVAGDSLLVMNSLLQKESMAGQVQAIYFDPPYGIKYGSNFQPFVNKRDVKDRKDEDLAKQRLMTASYDYYELRYPHEGLRGGFIWKTVPHVTLKSIANNPDIDAIYARMHPAIEAALKELNKALKAEAREWEVPFDFPGGDDKVRAAFDAFHAARQAMQKAMDRSIADHADRETLYDQPAKSKTKLRITGPFSVEAVPFPTVQALDDESRRWQDGDIEADASIARSGESARQHQWRDELLKTGIRGINATAGGQMICFAELETLAGTKYLHCTGHAEDGQRVVVHFGPEHAALEQRAVTNALEEAGNLFPLPKMIVFCAFAFDPEAAKDIDHLKGITALKAQMNTDLLTDDLKKARSSNQSFWLMGQPDVAVRKRKDGLYEVEVNGFDYFDTAKGELVSGGKGRIAMWSLDTDYDERSLFPHQVFFPLAGRGEGWEKLKKDIRAELDEELLTAFHGTVSLPFAAGDNRKAAVKIVDDRGIESLRIVGLE
jgi:hypothetical protein